VESDNPTSPIILEQDNEEKFVESNDPTNKPSLENQSNSLEKSDQPSHVQTPPYLERLTIEKSIKQLNLIFLGN
jgi:hypothetical protein